ncbi:uncharacterized protein LACBIDRAFT_298041 [Laccaria bicolor S238N-H82]|uniref:Predicted protein n=1 Tax=Laccaria bicolor (strain S238N-H82 / ATCC MYA-4686) TaxID=486041 RepID=B0DC44_LACBS|nr:uncharacterized protein LACBIDRAFT_298041 [Laccaria bicolor S238N-H82]EDR07672.1 predicted protein [Laccaria bicolor S238N-H82]|eukprot:XP_001881461.1 predicted protein [Laccaria bicolor S238N-H82]
MSFNLDRPIRNDHTTNNEHAPHPNPPINLDRPVKRPSVTKDLPSFNLDRPARVQKPTTEQLNQELHPIDRHSVLNLDRPVRPPATPSLNLDRPMRPPAAPPLNLDRPMRPPGESTHRNDTSLEGRISPELNLERPAPSTFNLDCPGRKPPPVDYDFSLRQPPTLQDVRNLKLDRPLRPPSMDALSPPSRATLHQDSAVLEASPPVGSHPITTKVGFNLDRPARTIKVKIEPSDNPPLSHAVPPTHFNLERPHHSPAASMFAADVVDLTCSPPATQLGFNLDRPARTIKVKIEPSDSPTLSHALPPTSFNLECPHASPAASLLTATDVVDLTGSPPAVQLNLDRPLHKARSSGLTSTTPPAMNLDRPLRKAKSALSYAGLPPSASNPPRKGTHPSVKEEMTREDWTDEKLDFPRNKKRRT